MDPAILSITRCLIHKLRLGFHWFNAGLDWAARRLKGGTEAIFSREDNDGQRWIQFTWNLALYLGGVAAWGVFFNWGHFPLDFHDWFEISAPRFTFLKDAVLHGLLPLHISDVMALGNATDRYLSIPDAFLSPQALLLRLMGIGHFVLADVWLMYTLGFIGLIWLQRRFRLSSVAFAMLFLLFNFNGHILAHYSVGHATWGGYFLFPWFALLVFDLLDGRRNWTWVALTAGLLAVMFLQGSFHQFVWCLLFLGFLALSDRRVFLPALSAAGFAVGVSLFRILPARLVISEIDYAFIGGPGLASIWDALVNIQTPERNIPFTNGILGGWESTLYVGLVGALFVGYFGIYRWLNPRLRKGGYPQLLLPVLALTVLSLGVVYGGLRQLLTPLLDSERAVSRIISLPFSFLILIATLEFQHWLDGASQRSKLVRAGVCGAVLIEGVDLVKNLSVWMVTNVAAAFESSPFRPAQWFVANHPDPAYFRTLWIGAAGSVLSLALLAGLVLWDRRVHGRRVSATGFRRSRENPAGLAVQPTQAPLVVNSKEKRLKSGR